MNPRSTIVKFLLCLLIIAAGSNAQKLISGTASVKLSGPADKETAAQTEKEALKNFRIELLNWLKEDAEVNIDTANAIQNKSFALFVDSCQSVSKKESTFKGKTLELGYYLTTDQADEKLKVYNDAVDKKAIEGWNDLKTALAGDDTRSIYVKGISALFFTLARFGPPLSTPDSGGRDLSEDVRRSVQKFFDKMTVTSSGMILAGKTGLPIENPPTVTLLVDSVPFEGFSFAGKLQNGTVLFSAVTDENGKLVINKTKVPFVPNGTLLDVCPNAAPAIGIEGFLDPVSMGIKMNNTQVQAFIFKIAKPVFTLDYKASSASTISMPPDFAEDTHVKKFLRDSCYLQERSTGGKVDLAITINTQVSSYEYDATEELGIKVTARIMVNGLLLDPPRTNEELLVFEKRYERYLTPPYGLYFWEANGKLREAIKATIAGL